MVVSSGSLVWARTLALLVVMWNAPDALAQQSGCSDGQREGFVDRFKYPNIAGCSGGWSLPGTMVSTPGFAPYCPTVPFQDTLTPACDRDAGDDSANPSGTGCNVADLCAPGWHVCATTTEVAASSPTGCDGATRTGDPSLFFLTRQAGTGYGVCASGTDTGAQCHSLSGATGCLQTARTSNLGAPWSCHEQVQGLCESHVVRKLTRLLDGQVLLTGGDACPMLETGARLIADSVPCTPPSTAAQLYQPGAGRWSLTGTPALQRPHHAAVRLPSGQVLVVGGLGAHEPASAEWYRASTP